MRARAALELPAGPRTLASSRLWRRGDRALLLAVAAVTAFGLVLGFSASAVQGGVWVSNAADYCERQLMWLALGIILLFVGANLDYHRLRPLAMPLGLVTAGLLVVVLLAPFGVGG